MAKMGISFLLAACVYLGRSVAVAVRDDGNARLSTLKWPLPAGDRFEAHVTDIGNQAQKVVLLWASGEQLSWREVVHLWAGDHDFRKFFEQLIADSPYAGLFWECPAVKASDVLSGRLFEFVILRNPSAFAEASPEMFGDKLSICRDPTDAVVFSNLHGDTTLIAPCVPESPEDASAFGDLASFSRSASEPAQQSLWAKVGATLLDKFNHSDDEIWLNTEGLGVPWLHVRLDEKPKYYHYSRYVDYET